MPRVLSLKPSHALMNPNFDGYKLCCDADIALYSKEVSEGVESHVSGPTCYLGTRLQALHNHLFYDPFHPSSIYHFTSRGHLLKYTYSEDSRLTGGDVVWQAELVNENSCEDDEEEDRGQFHASVSFPSPDLAVVSSGHGSLHLLETGQRSAPTDHSWLEKMKVETVRGVVLQACMRSEGNETAGDKNQIKIIECLLLSITTPDELTGNPDFTVTDNQLASSKATSLHLLYWLTLSNTEGEWEVSRTRVLAGEGAIQYCSLDHSTSGIILLTHKSYSFVADSASPIPEPERKKEKILEGPKYMYKQTDEDMTLWLIVGEALKGDLSVKVTATDLSVKVKDIEVLQGHFLHNIQAECTTWSLSDGRLEIVVVKGREGEQWESVFEGDGCEGEEVVELGPEVTTRLAHLTSEEWNPNPNPDVPVYDPGQIEACDQAGEELTLMHLCGSSHSPIAIAYLGPTQHLFNVQIKPGGATAFCLRYDVDAVLWQPEGEGDFTHTTTYDAFGYVRASKTSAKFTCASSDFSYVAVGDTRSHIYVFYQPGVVGEGELRNRRSGKRVGKVARQLVISLKTHDQILGLHTAPGLLFVLTENKLYLYSLPTS